jgi:hypothetical protein
MPTVKELQTALADVTKTLSLYQVGKRSKINYVTLRNIKSGKSTRVTEGVSKRLMKFIDAYQPEAAVKIKRGRIAKTPKAAASKAPAVKAPKKAAPGRKTGKRGRPRKQIVAAPAPKTTGKRGRPKKQIVAAPAPKKTGKRGRPKKQIAPAPSPQGTATPAMFLGDALVKEIGLVKARLDWLLSLQRAEATYIKAIK